MPDKEDQTAEVEEPTELDPLATDEEEAVFTVNQLAREYARKSGEKEDAGSEKSDDESSGLDLSAMPTALKAQFEALQQQNQLLQKMVEKMKSGEEGEPQESGDETEYEYDVNLPETYAEDVAPALKDLGKHVDGRIRPVEKAVGQLLEGFNQWKTEFDIWRFGQEHQDWKEYKKELDELSEKYPQMLDTYDGLEGLLKLAKSSRDDSELQEFRKERKRSSSALRRLPPSRTAARQTMGEKGRAKTIAEAIEMAADRMKRDRLI